MKTIVFKIKYRAEYDINVKDKIVYNFHNTKPALMIMIIIISHNGIVDSGDRSPTCSS